MTKVLSFQYWLFKEAAWLLGELEQAEEHLLQAAEGARALCEPQVARMFAGWLAGIFDEAGQPTAPKKSGAPTPTTSI